MKKTTLTLLIALSGLISFGQQQIAKAKDQELSNAGKFSDRSGSLIQREFIDIGTLKKCDIQIAIFTDLISGQKSTAVRFEYQYKSSYSSDTKVALLDGDEIEGLIKSIKIIQEKIFPTTATNYTEVNFKSRSGFVAGCFSDKKSWTTFMKLDKYDGNSYVFMEKEDLGKLLDLMQQAKSKL